MSAKTATYKGKTYRVEFIGETKHGRRAKLAFMDGSKEFWVSASDVTVSNGSYTPTARRSGGRMRTCFHCGGNEANQVDCGYCA